MLKPRDIFMLQTLDKVTLATNNQLSILCGYRDRTVCRKKLKSLEDQGYVYSDWLGDKKAFTLTQLGLSQIEKTRHAYEIRGIKSEHEELVTEAACLVYAKTGRSIFDMVFDREMGFLASFRGSISHRPDICFSQHQAVEVEITPKKLYGTSEKSGLDDNFRSNCENFTRQIWIVPYYRHKMIASLYDMAETYGVKDKVTIMTIDELKEQVKAFNLKSNSPRMEPVKGIPSPKNSNNERSA